MAKKSSTPKFQESEDVFTDLQELPRLLLAITVNQGEVKDAPAWSPVHYKFKPKRRWHYLKHQISGKAHRSVYIIATELKPYPQVLNEMHVISKRFYPDSYNWSAPHLHLKKP
jgi:hypothetical protein